MMNMPPHPSLSKMYAAAAPPTPLTAEASTPLDDISTPHGMTPDFLSELSQ